METQKLNWLIWLNQWCKVIQTSNWWQDYSVGLNLFYVLYMTVRYTCTHSLSKILTNGLIKPFRGIFISYILQQMSQTLGPPLNFLYSQIAYFIPITECGSAQNLRIFWFNIFVTGLRTEKVCLSLDDNVRKDSKGMTMKQVSEFKAENTCSAFQDTLLKER